MDASEQGVGFRLSAICKYCAITSKDLRAYHDAGLLAKPAIGKAKRPVYYVAHMERILAIRGALSLGLTLNQVGQLLAIGQDEPATALPPKRIREQIYVIQTQVARLLALEALLTDLAGNPGRDKQASRRISTLLASLGAMRNAADGAEELS